MLIGKHYGMLLHKLGERIVSKDTQILLLKLKRRADYERDDPTGDLYFLLTECIEYIEKNEDKAS